ncbi:MAG: hypothetical protein RBJ76_18340 [Stenomitos frigidus ULC029]
MNVLESLTLNSATALLNCLQYSYLESGHSINYLTANVLTAALCDVLSQLETEFPGVVEDCGWMAIGTDLPAKTERFSVLAKDIYR